MHIQLNINTDVEIKCLTDLPKLKVLLESSNMKINKSQLARELGVDRRTVGKYLDGYTPKNTRNKTSKIDNFTRLLKHCFPMNDRSCYTTNEYYGNI